MSNREWVEFNIKVEGFEGTLKDIRLEEGKLYQPGVKFYEDGCKCTTVPAERVEGTKIKNGESYKLASCGFSDAEGWFSYPINNVGRGDAPCGTIGFMQIFDGDKPVAKIKWYNAQGSNASRYRVISLDKGYSVKSCDKNCGLDHIKYNKEVMNIPGWRNFGYDLGKVNVVIKKN